MVESLNEQSEMNESSVENSGHTQEIVKTLIENYWEIEPRGKGIIEQGLDEIEEHIWKDEGAMEGGELNLLELTWKCEDY